MVAGCMSPPSTVFNTYTTLTAAFSLHSLDSVPAVSIELLLHLLDGGRIKHTVQIYGWPFQFLWDCSARLQFPSSRWDALSWEINIIREILE